MSLSGDQGSGLSGGQEEHQYMKGFEPRQKRSQDEKGTREMLQSYYHSRGKSFDYLVKWQCGIAWPQPVGHGRDGDRRHCRWGWEAWGCLRLSPAGATVQSWVQRNTERAWPCCV